MRRPPDDGLRDIVREHLPGVFWQPIELGMRSGGVPDLLGIADGRTIWIECKATDGWDVSLRPGQIAWMLRWVREGGTATVAVRRRVAAGRRRESADELHVMDAAYCREIRVGGLRGCPAAALLGCWDGGPARWPWWRVRALLVR